MRDGWALPLEGLVVLLGVWIGSGPTSGRGPCKFIHTGQPGASRRGRPPRRGGPPRGAALSGMAGRAFAVAVQTSGHQVASVLDILAFDSYGAYGRGRGWFVPRGPDVCAC